jgi:hypothetical protein
MTLTLERRGQENLTANLGNVSLCPPVSEDYWEYRVRLSHVQSIVGFPKFTTIGIGFAVEEDWNTNLPYTSRAEEIRDHILHNKGDDSISDDNVLEAIRLIQSAVSVDREVSR